MSDWTSRLRQASFRGLPFGVLLNDRTTGRRLAVHEYPGRDDPFVEDMGRATRHFAVRGFLLENSVAYRGGALDDQIVAMEAAAELQGPGELVHPLRGRITVNVERLTTSEKWERGRYVELSFELVLSGSALFGIPVLATAAAVVAAAASATSLLSGLFGDDADGYISSTGALGDLTGAASGFSAQALGISGGVFGAGGLNGSAALTASLSTYTSAAAGLGLITGAGAATAAAATGVVQAIGSTASTGSAIDSLLDFGDWG